MVALYTLGTKEAFALSMVRILSLIHIYQSGETFKMEYGNGKQKDYGAVSYTHLQGITEELKARDQMEWVRLVNGIRNMAEEIVLKELVYI